jgi:hypothetical protein
MSIAGEFRLGPHPVRGDTFSQRSQAQITKASYFLTRRWSIKTSHPYGVMPIDVNADYKHATPDGVKPFGFSNEL